MIGRPMVLYLVFCLGPLARYVKLLVAHAAPGMPGTFSSPPGLSNPDMHHDTCVTHVPWCLPGSLTSDFILSRFGENVPGIPGACATHKITYLVRGSLGNTLDRPIATRVNKKLHHLTSPFPGLWATDIDSMTVAWSGIDIAYTFLPFKGITTALAKMRVLHSLTMIFIEPYPLKAYWVSVDQLFGTPPVPMATNSRVPLTKISQRQSSKITPMLVLSEGSLQS